MNKKIKRLATTTIICVLVASIFGSVMVLAPPPDFIFPQLIDVFVTNTSDDPIPVDIMDDTLDVTLDEPIDVTLDEPIEVISTQVFEIVQFDRSLTCWDGWPGLYACAFFIALPYILVIDYISVKADGIDASDSLSVAVITRVNGEDVEHYLGLVEPKGRSIQYLSKEVKIYADPHTDVCVRIERLTELNDVYIDISMCGHYMLVTDY